jgi:tRNA (cytidine/uridine-2'-O-)-methyltransferase
MKPLFHVVLLEPEIPNNTGNIGRTCVATGCALHLVHPLGFDTSEKACRRAGLDYWPRLRVREHASWPEFVRSWEGLPRSDGRRWSPWFLTTKATRPIYDARFEIGDCLVFGKETVGLPAGLLAEHRERTLTLPMVPGERSLNLSVAAAVVVYEGVRQLVARGEVTLDGAGRIGEPAPPASGSGVD